MAMSYLTVENQIYLFSAIILLTASYLSFVKEKEKLTLLFLFAGAFLLRMFIITIDPFLHNWDERFHALVAKNMIDDPFKPMLRKDPVLPFHYTDWANNNIWLHKQPVFLWQMALSMKLFGINEIALRLPSVILGALQTILIYRIGKLLLNREVGFMAAILFSCSYFQLQQTCGFIGMDHNDVAFGFYITASIWSLIEYKNAGNKYWILLIGLFSGLAIMNKWLPGLLVYAGWGLAILADKKLRFSIRSYFGIAVALLITCLTVIPWQLYISATFPIESSYEYNLNSLHIFRAVEGHKGTFAFYINKFSKEHYGYWALLPFILGSWMIARKLKSTSMRLIFFVPVAAIYLFFSMIVTTKLTGYVFVISSIMFIIIAAGLYFLLQLIPQIKIRTTLFAITLACTFLLNFSFNRIINSHFNLVIESNRTAKISNTAIYKKLNELVPAGYIVFNVPKYEHTEAMFYSDRNVYYNWPTEVEYEMLKAQERKIAVFKPHHELPMPSYIQDDPEVMVIDFKLN